MRSEDLPKPKILKEDRNASHRPCPNCGKAARREHVYHRRLHDVGDLVSGRPVELSITYSQHHCQACNKYFMTNLGLWLVLILVIPQITAGNVRGVMLGTFALMTLASFEAVLPLPFAAQMWNASREAAKRLFEVVDAEPTVKESGDQRHLHSLALPTRASARAVQVLEINSSDLQFSDLSFS